MKILIGGDLVPTISNKDMFSNPDILGLLGKELSNIWYTSDFRILNLEVPITNNEYPIEKCGCNLIADIENINGIRQLKPSLFTLANNHILDQGEEGLKSTISILNQSSIPFIGAGENLVDAQKPYMIDIDNYTIGVYACAENEFSIATDKSFGANPFDPLESLDHIEKLKEKCDYVIVLYHGGKEHYRYPSPYLQRVCKKIAQKGADLVICQHSHCIGCFEEYNDSTIVYGQGNFIFDDCDDEFWNSSLLIKVNLEEDLEIEYIPIVKEKNVIRIAEDDEKDSILDEFYKRSKEILETGFIEEKYKSFAKKNINIYLRSFLGFGLWLSRFDRRLFKGKLVSLLYNKKKLLSIRNFIECEAHRELILQALREEDIFGEK